MQFNLQLKFKARMPFCVSLKRWAVCVVFFPLAPSLKVKRSLDIFIFFK